MRAVHRGATRAHAAAPTIAPKEQKIRRLTGRTEVLSNAGECCNTLCLGLPALAAPPTLFSIPIAPAMPGCDVLITHTVQQQDGRRHASELARAVLIQHRVHALVRPWEVGACDVMDQRRAGVLTHDVALSVDDDKSWDAIHLVPTNHTTIVTRGSQHSGACVHTYFSDSFGFSPVRNGSASHGYLSTKAVYWSSFWSDGT